MKPADDASAPATCTHSWLETICDPERREFYAHPWRITDDSVIATDGRLLVYLTGGLALGLEYPRLPEEGKESKESAAILVAVADAPVLHEGVALPRLLEWVGPFEPDKTALCFMCGGMGFRECHVCGSQDAECPECSGSGSLPVLAEKRWGVVQGVKNELNLNLLAKALPNLAATGAGGPSPTTCTIKSMILGDPKTILVPAVAFTSPCWVAVLACKDYVGHYEKDSTVVSQFNP